MRERFSFTATSVAIAALLVLLWLSARAQGIRGSTAEAVSSSLTGVRSGIVTDRLDRKQRKIWKAMDQIVFAQDDSGRPLHPLLHELFTWAASGDFAIYIEMPRPQSVSPYKAAECMLEKRSWSSGSQPTFVIRLYIGVIDQARIERVAGESVEFVPFAGLSGEERYCESLAHELAHARKWLTSPEYARLLEEQEKTNHQFLQLVHRKGKDESARQNKLAIHRVLSALGEEIERPAIEVERQVWSELTATRELRLVSRKSASTLPPFSTVNTW